MKKLTESQALSQFDDAVYKYAHQWYRYPSISQAFELEDIAQIARTYIVLAVREFDDSKGMTQSTYIIQRVRWGLNTSLRSMMPKAKRETTCVSIDALTEEQSDRWHPTYTETFSDDFEDTLAALPSAAQFILRLRYLEGHSLASIGTQIGKSAEWVRQYIKKVTSNLKVQHEE